MRNDFFRNSIHRAFFYGFKGQKSVIKAMQSRLGAGLTLCLIAFTFGKFLRHKKVLRKEAEFHILRGTGFMKGGSRKSVAVFEVNPSVPLLAVNGHVFPSLGYEGRTHSDLID
jgi:hypothetical protein